MGSLIFSKIVTWCSYSPWSKPETTAYEEIIFVDHVIMFLRVNIYYFINSDSYVLKSLSIASDDGTVSNAIKGEPFVCLQ